MTTQPHDEKDRIPANGVGRGTAFGTFGELLQGVHADNDWNFLVTFPIARFTRATFTIDQQSSTIQVVPAYKKKARWLAAMMLEHFGLPCGGKLELDSDIPVGKGLASSSADLVATARAVAACVGRDIEIQDVQKMIRSIEPTDGVMYDGVVSFYHREVELREYLGPLPPLCVVSIDEGGIVDTVEYNKLPQPFTDEEKREYRDLLEQISEAVRCHDLRTIGQVATRSSVMNQKLRPKATLPALLELAEEIDALGIIVAHSGTCIGLLLSPQDPQFERQMQTACERLLQVADEVTVYESWEAEMGLPLEKPETRTVHELT